MLITSQRSSPAFARSAEFYDEIYQDRGPIYDRDVFLVESAFDDFSQSFEKRVVDWGAGTGEHVRRFRASGWNAVGFDPCPEMADAANRKGVMVLDGSILKPADSVGLVALGDVSLQTSLFAAFSYATLTDDDLSRALENVRRWSCPAGLFIFDVINHHSAAASHLRDSRNSDRAIDTGRIWRSMRKTFDIETSIVTAEMSYQIRRNPPAPASGRQGGQPPECFSETHKLRAYTPREISTALARHGFDVLRMFDPESEQIEGGPIRADSYYFMVVARVR